LKPLLEEELFQRGVRLFNHGEFFECHEVLEDLWRPLRGPRRLFLQAVIHLAVGLYHHQRQNSAGADRQLRKGLKKLAGYLPEYEGVDTLALYEAGAMVLERIREGGSVDPAGITIRLRESPPPGPPL
jgi:predicted metal-dependent hydrolase